MTHVRNLKCFKTVFATFNGTKLLKNMIKWSSAVGVARLRMAQPTKLVSVAPTYPNFSSIHPPDWFELIIVILIQYILGLCDQPQKFPKFMNLTRSMTLIQNVAAETWQTAPGTADMAPGGVACGREI